MTRNLLSLYFMSTCVGDCVFTAVITFLYCSGVSVAISSFSCCSILFIVIPLVTSWGHNYTGSEAYLKVSVDFGGYRYRLDISLSLRYKLYIDII